MPTSYSFSTVTFNVLRSGSGHSVSSDITVTHIPFSGTNYIFVGGSLENRYPYTIMLASIADYNTLAGKRDQTYTLIGPDGTFTAALASLERQEPVLPDGKVIAKASFLVA